MCRQPREENIFSFHACCVACSFLDLDHQGLVGILVRPDRLSSSCYQDSATLNTQNSKIGSSMTRDNECDFLNLNLFVAISPEDFLASLSHPEPGRRSIARMALDIGIRRRLWRALVDSGRLLVAAVGFGWHLLASIGFVGRPWCVLDGCGWRWLALVGFG